MFLAGANFVLHYMALKGKLGSFWKDQEFRFYAIVVVLFAGLCTLLLMVQGSYTSLSQAVRDSFFQVISIMTTTGYTTADFNLWPQALRFLLLLAMFLGGCSGSTGGGIKQVRILILVKLVGTELKRLLHPKQIQKIRLNNLVLKNDEISSITSFFILYLSLFIAGSFIIIMITGMDLETGVSSVAATLGNIGPGLGAVGAVGNYSFINIPGKWILSLCMLLGRLELFSVVMLFLRGTWRQ